MSLTNLILEKNHVEALKLFEEILTEKIAETVEERTPAIAASLFGEATVIHPPKKDNEDEEDEENTKSGAFQDKDGDGDVNQFDNDDDGDGVHDDDDVKGGEEFGDDVIGGDEAEMKARGNKVTVTIETQ